MAAWNNFFFAQVGASAALVGLIFVAVSINLTKILSWAPLPDRAFEALLVLLSILITSSLMLVPEQPLALVGIEVLIVGLFTWVIVARINLRNYRKTDAQYRRLVLRNIGLNQLALLPTIIRWHQHPHMGNRWPILVGSRIYLIFRQSAAGCVGSADRDQPLTLSIS